MAGRTAEEPRKGRDETLVRVLERFANQLEQIELYLRDLQLRQAELEQTILRSRSDMGKITAVQDELDHAQKQIVNRQEALVNRQTALVGAQDGFQQNFAELSRHVSGLHMDTEKRLGEANRDTQRRLEELRLEVMRRLLTLDSAEAALGVLLRRTEPPEPKEPMWFVRQFFRLKGYLAAKWALLRRRWR
jgi:predicted  nucleic acid-binding Zn-ribbon protein